MLDLCIFTVTKRLIARANKVEKVNLQSDHIIRILNGFMSGAVPHNIVQSFRNARISLILDDDRVVRCNITSDPAQFLLGTPFSDPLGHFVAEEEEDGGDDPNIEIFEMQMLAIFDISEE
jgi:hypothetical protein